MMDSIGYQFDPTQQKALVESLNGATAHFGPMAQQALQVLSMRIPSVNGAPLAGAEPMEKPMLPPPVVQSGQQQPGGLGVFGAALNPSGKPGQQSGSPGGSITFNLPHPQQTPQMPQQGPQQAPGAAPAGPSVTSGPSSYRPY